jgi:hypothetical protein
MKWQLTQYTCTTHQASRASLPLTPAITPQPAQGLIPAARQSTKPPSSLEIPLWFQTKAVFPEHQAFQAPAPDCTRQACL